MPVLVRDADLQDAAQAVDEGCLQSVTGELDAGWCGWCERDN